MCRSFVICETSGKNRNIFVEKFHVNFWVINKREIYLDLGFLIRVRKEDISDGFKFIIHSPFSVGKDPTDLAASFETNKQNLQVIFNEEVESIENLCKTGRDGSAQINFRSGENFVIAKPEIHKIDAEKIELNISFDSVNPDKLKDEFKIYSRFRYKVDNKDSANIYLTSKGFHEEIFLDIRINELRLFKPDELKSIIDTRVSIESCQIFAVTPLPYKLSMDGRRQRRYVRFLEKTAFESYLDRLKKVTGDFIIYYWKQSFTSSSNAPADDTFNMVVSFETERRTLEYLQFAFVGLLASLIILEMAQSGFIPQLSKIVKLMGGLSMVFSGLILGILGNASYHYIRTKYDIWRGN